MRAFRSRNFRLFFTGQSISLIGTWMTRIATGWLVYKLTHSAKMLGIVGFAGQIPTFLLAPFAGVWIERMDRRKLLVWTQVLAGIQSLTIAFLTLAKVITIHELLLLSACQGIINAFDMPGRQAALVKMVNDRESLRSAIALNSSMVNIARLIGPAIAGLLIAAVGEGWCFLVDGLSYIAVIASLLMMRLDSSKGVSKAPPKMIEGLKDGWAYVSTFLPVRTILLLFAVVSLMGFPYMVLMPLFASDVLHGGAHMLGWLSSASGIGAVISAITLALRRGVRGLTRMIQIACFLFGGGLILLGYSHWFVLSMVALLFIGFGMMQGIAASNTVIQTLVPEDKRGRVMSYYTVAFVGMAPFGSLLGGTLANRFGPQHTVMLTGAVCILGAAWFSTQLPKIREEMRPVYEELGILPKKPLEPAVNS
ncbi:MAG: MFS transporter [Acidobacteriaceae bacterium]|nr:MFS transporter [Acidobacteriaceae bacterium]